MWLELLVAENWWHYSEAACSNMSAGVAEIAGEVAAVLAALAAVVDVVLTAAQPECVAGVEVVWEGGSEQSKDAARFVLPSQELGGEIASL